MRLYGDLRAPVVDLDFRPHAHNWNGAVRDGGVDVIPFMETVNNKDVFNGNS
jgi:hypothetical protein